MRAAIISHAPCVVRCWRRADCRRPLACPPGTGRASPVCRSRAALPEAITCDIRSAVGRRSHLAGPGVTLSSTLRAPTDVDNDAAVRLCTYCVHFARQRQRRRRFLLLDDRWLRWRRRSIMFSCWAAVPIIRRRRFPKLHLNRVYFMQPKERMESWSRM